MRDFQSDRLKSIFPSDIRAMTRECNRVGGINLGQGLCDLPTPQSVKEGAIQAIRSGKKTYGLSEGLGELREAIARKLKRDNQIEADPEREIVVSAGTTGAFAITLTALLNPGDGLLLMEPYYGYHLNTAKLFGIEPHFMALKAPDFPVEKEHLKAALQPSTKAIMVCTPSNPSGKVFSKSELETIAEVARENDLLVLTDEIYEYFYYGNEKPISPASLPELKDRTVSIMGFSKTLSVTGWRMGYAVAPQAMAQRLSQANDLMYVCASTPLQHGVYQSLFLDDDFYQSMRTSFKKKRDRFCEALKEAGLEPIVPQGAYYVLADVSELGFTDSYQAAMQLLEKTKVAAVPGRSFYQSEQGEKFLRFSFAVEDEVLDRACRALRENGV